MTGIERRRRQRGHRLEVAFEALGDALAVPAKNVALAFAAALFQVLVERLEARKARQRNREVAPRPAHQTFHRPLSLPLPGRPYRSPMAEAPPRFEAAETVAGAGVLLALPALLQQGLLDVTEGLYGRLNNGFFGLRSVLLTRLRQLSLFAPASH